MIKIGAFAKICGVSTQTLRYYDSEGVLSADVTDPSSGYRFYSLEAVERFKKILFYKNLGFTLEEIKNILSSTPEQVQILLKKKRDELSKSSSRLKETIVKLDEMLDGGSEKPGWSDILLVPFEDDPRVVGKWKICGKLDDKNKLIPCEENESFGANSEIIFLPGGAFAWIYFWTKGILYRLTPKYKFAIPNPYTITEKDGTEYLTVQFMSDDCIDRAKDPVTLIYLRINSIAYTERTIRRRIDDTDIGFSDDENVRGNWTAIDLVNDISAFDPKRRRFKEEDLYTVNIEFLPRGVCMKTVRTISGNVKTMLRYTKGIVLNDKEMTAEEYRILTDNGKEYLFVQHKSGDYYYGGMDPVWYVFERKEE